MLAGCPAAGPRSELLVGWQRSEQRCAWVSGDHLGTDFLRLADLALLVGALAAAYREITRTWVPGWAARMKR